MVRKSNLSNLNLSNSNFPKKSITNKDQYSEAKVFSQGETITRRKIRKEIKNIMSSVYTTLHNASITVSGASLVNIRHEFENTLTEADGITRHGVMRFRAVVFDS